MEVIHEGPLERCITDAKKVEWKKAYYVFRKHSSSGSKTFEFFKDSNWKKQEPRGVINLFSSYSVNMVDRTKKKYMFELTTVDKAYELYANSETSRQKWVDVLNDGLVVTFNVALIASPPNAYQYVKDFIGTFQLQISDVSVTLRSNLAKSITWKFNLIRRYKSHNGDFVIEVGRKSITGEGEFKFETDTPVKLFDVLDKAVKERSKAKGIEGRGHSVVTAVPNQPPVDIPARGRLTPPNMSPKTRSYSDQSNQPIEPLDNEYSHIHSIANQHAKMKHEAESEYDKLFSSNRLVNHRRSEPAIRPNHLPIFDNNKRISGNTLVSPLAEVDMEETYMDMAGGNSPEPKPKPKPVPRIKQIGSPIGPAPAKPPLRKTNSTPTEENTYDSLAATSPLRTLSEKNPKDYDQLFNHVSNVTNAPNYSHLNQIHETTVQKNVPMPHHVEDSLYDMPKALSNATALPRVLPAGSVPASLKQQGKNNSPPAVARKVPLKPSRPAPLLPLQSQNGRESRKSFTPTSPNAGSVILKLKRNLSQAEQPDEDDDEEDDEHLYSSPTSQLASPIEYNKVGDIIAGEYIRTREVGGYVEVPEENSDDLYQVPRGEKISR